MSDTSVNNKRIAKNTVLLYFRMLFTMGVTLYTSRVVLNALGVEDFGIYNVVGGVITMFSFLNSAMSSATQRYFTFELGKANKKQLQKVFNISISIHGLISILVLLLGETIGLWFMLTQMTIPLDRIDAAMWVYQFSILSCIVMIMSVPYNAAIIAHEKMSAFAYISILEVVLKLVIVYILVVSSFDKLKLYAVLMFLIQLISRFVYGIYCKMHFPETHYQFIWDKKLFKEMLGFAGWNLFGNMAAVTFTQGVNILLNIFFGPVVNASRGIAVQVQSAINGFSMNFQMAMNPQITKSYATNDLSYMHSLIIKSSKYSFFLLLFISLPVLIETELILSWWLKIVPEHAVSFIRIMLCITMIDAMANPLMTSAQATGHIRIYQAVIGGILFLILPVSYITLKLGGDPNSVFIVHLLIAIFAQFVRLWIIGPMIQLPFSIYFKKVILRVIIVTIISIISPILCYTILQNTPKQFILVCLCCFLSVGVTTYLIGLNRNEQIFFMQRISTISKKITRK